MNDIMQEAFDAYFGNSEDTNQKNVSVQKKEYQVPQIMAQRMADGNIDDIDQLADILKRLCNAAWGSNWGEFSPDLKRGEHADTIMLPQITIGINEKDIAEGKPIKPILFDSFKEIDENGKETGDVFFAYRQWFDCNIEFDIYAQTNAEARKLKNNFRKLILSYTGYLKKSGISEIYFLKEVPSKMSLNYNEKLPMIPLYYYIRFEEITVVRKSLIDKIDVELNIPNVDAEQIMMIVENGETSNIDLHFYTREDKNRYEF